MDASPVRLSFWANISSCSTPCPPQCVPGLPWSPLNLRSGLIPIGTDRLDSMFLFLSLLRKVSQRRPLLQPPFPYFLCFPRRNSERSSLFSLLSFPLRRGLFPVYPARRGHLGLILLAFFFFSSRLSSVSETSSVTRFLFRLLSPSLELRVQSLVYSFISRIS